MDIAVATINIQVNFFMLASLPYSSNVASGRNMHQYGVAVADSRHPKTVCAAPLAAYRANGSLKYPVSRAVAVELLSLRSLALVSVATEIKPLPQIQLESFSV